MSKIAVFFAEGFEEIEALNVVDICRRCGVETDMIALGGELYVAGGHNIVVKADRLIEDIDYAQYDILVLPGGLKGTQGLEAHEGLMAQIDKFYAEGKYIAAICAAPSIFGHRGILKGRNACSHMNFESHLEGAAVSKNPVEISDHVITSRGMGTAMDFGLSIAALFVGKEKAMEVAKGFVYEPSSIA